MVNFKASGHQGERKRAQATQGAHDAAAVSKLEKLKLHAEDLKCVNPNGVPLKVVAREKECGGENNSWVKAALVAPETLAKLGAEPGTARVLLCRPGGDFVLSARASAEVAEGEVLLGEAQRLSLHVCEDEYYEWVPFELPADDDGGCSCELASLTVEAQLMFAPLEGTRFVQDATVLGSRISKWLFDEVVSDNEIFIVTVPEGRTQLVLRVTGCTLPEAADDDDDDGADESAAAAGAQDEAGGRVVRSSHCYRGLVSARTRVYVGRSTVFASSASQRAVCDGLELTHVVAPPERPPKNAVLVTTRDGELFPVHRRLLKPCISLTKAVRDASCAAPEADVDVDCATFDRVLLFLEAANRGAADAYAFDMQTLPELATAAAALQCRPLKEACARKLGAFEERIQIHRWPNVVRHNEGGGCWVTMDGMVFDLEAWLPEHPGGATIIPSQALNLDCTVFFELYHASRESFTYLKEFYIGELHADDRELVPRSDESPSDDFMTQLREFSAPFRITTEPSVAVFKSF
mmetsp:Transcript_45300/g.118919  ORF Transcript_45300/g.118919 Transcript_45300/m.118919 type:complete len:522 (+) Transcript_45300:3-1568(+)